ncbi:hypothetical protein CRG98_014004 [Punica granatum]|uniref:Uncharacterized protein n=1 Tax=Punica granatum TaxID=22663 RepID=A0A2I0KAQ6_PUNGR|nr:hypothetical protein CRG98_014004 [Punica granatum]
MEEHKVRALHHFIKRSKQPFELFVGAVREVLHDLMFCYGPLDQKWHDDKDAFLQLMILDGCFMLEILRSGTHTVNDYARNDPIFSNHGKDKEFVDKLVLKFCCPGMPIMKMGKCLHVLDLFRKILLHEGPRKETLRSKLVTSYVLFMDDIIKDSERDVALLHFRGIIYSSAIGSDRAVAEQFNSLAKDLTLDPESSLDVVEKKVIDCGNKPWNVWRAYINPT